MFNKRFSKQIQKKQEEVTIEPGDQFACNIWGPEYTTLEIKHVSTDGERVIYNFIKVKGNDITNVFVFPPSEYDTTADHIRTNFTKIDSKTSLSDLEKFLEIEPIYLSEEYLKVDYKELLYYFLIDHYNALKVDLEMGRDDYIKPLANASYVIDKKKNTFIKNRTGNEYLLEHYIKGQIKS